MKNHNVNLQSIVLGEADIKTDFEKHANEKNKSSQISAQWDLAMRLISSHEDLQVFASREDGDGILRRTNDAVRVLQDVLKGLHDNEIADGLSRQDSMTDSWWAALLRVIQGTFLPSLQDFNRSATILTFNHQFSFIHM